MPIRMGIPARWMRSPWVMMPMGRLSSSTTGIPEKMEDNSNVATSLTGVVSVTLRGEGVMMSLTLR